MEEKFSFNYSKYRSKKVSVKVLDGLIDVVLSSGTNYISAIIAGIKIIVVFAFMWARKGLIEEEIQIQRQEFEQRTSGEIDDVINSDDLD